MFFANELTERWDAGLVAGRRSCRVGESAIRGGWGVRCTEVRVEIKQVRSLILSSTTRSLTTAPSMEHSVCPTSVPSMNPTQAHSIVPTEVDLNIHAQMHSIHPPRAHSMSPAQAH